MNKLFAVMFFIALTIGITSNNTEEQFVSKFHYVDPELYKYLHEFIELTGYEGENELIVMEFDTDLHPRILGIAIGMHIDNVIYIKVNLTAWNKLSVNQRYYVVMHELGHDLLNWEHHYNYTMGTPLPYFVTDSNIQRIKQDLIDYSK